MTITPYTIRPNELDQYHRKILRQGLTNQRFPEHEFSQLTQEMRDHLSQDRCLPADAGQSSSSDPSMAMKILKSLCCIIDKSPLARASGRAMPGLSHRGKPAPDDNTQGTHAAPRNSPVLKLARITLLTESKQKSAEESNKGNSTTHHGSIPADEKDTVIGMISNPNPGRGPPHILTSHNVGSQRYNWSKHNPDAPDDDINVWKIADLAAATKSESDISWEPCTQYSESPSDAIPPFFHSVDSVVLDDDGEPIAHGKRRESTIHGVDENPAIHSANEHSVIHSDKESLVEGDEHEAILADEEEADPEDVSRRENGLADCSDAGEGPLGGEEGGEVDDGWATSSASSFASTVHPSDSISVASSEYSPGSEGEMDTHDGPKPAIGSGGGRPGALRRKKLRIPQLSRPHDPPDLLFSGPNLPPSPSPPCIGFASHPSLSRSAHRGG